MLNKNGKANLGLPVLMLLACTLGSGTFGLHAQTGWSADKVEPASAFAPTGYRLLGRYPVSGDGSWDYIALDSVARRLYVSHGAQVQVLDADSGKIVGQIADTPGVHGVALAPELHRGFTSNGGDKSVTMFDTDKLTPIKKIQIETGTDNIVYDSSSQRVFPLNEKTTVLDAQSGKVAGTVNLGGSPEAGVSDGNGAIYVNIADRNVVAVVDAKTLSVVKTFPLAFCTSPHSLSYDPINRRLLVGCRSGMFVALDVATGKVVGGTLVCSGVDSSGFDPTSKLVFESCGEGVISVIRQITPDHYELIETIPTHLWAMTMAFDPLTKRIYLPVAEFEIVSTPGPQQRPERKIKPGSFSVVVVGK